VPVEFQFSLLFLFKDDTDAFDKLPLWDKTPPKWDVGWLRRYESNAGKGKRENDGKNATCCHHERLLRQIFEKRDNDVRFHFTHGELCGTQAEDKTKGR
jgi:hypothetical protein